MRPKAESFKALVNLGNEVTRMSIHIKRNWGLHLQGDTASPDRGQWARETEDGWHTSSHLGSVRSVWGTQGRMRCEMGFCAFGLLRRQLRP